MKMILILLFLSDFWLSILNLENAKSLKKKQKRINASSVVSQQMVGLLRSRGWEKRNRADFY